MTIDHADRPKVTAIYIHKKYGGMITVYDDGTMQPVDARGKRKKTSATPAKLALGHGGWERVR